MTVRHRNRFSHLDQGMGDSMFQGTGNEGTAITSNYTHPGMVHVIWLIARRQMLEALLERSSVIMTAFFLVFQAALVYFSLRPLLQERLNPQTIGITATLIAFYLLLIGLMPSSPAIGIAAGVFAGDKERGCLTPILVLPISNTAIFAGKILGAVVPALLYSAINIIAYYLEILYFGPDKLKLLPLDTSLLTLLLIPGVTIFGAALATIISSRVRTFQAAQTYSSVISTVLWFVLLGLIFVATAQGLLIFIAAVLAIYSIDALLISIAATTWRREEVIAHL
jgi:ABC-type transport system involved in multi-copper enzyme maturation permease subunit